MAQLSGQSSPDRQTTYAIDFSNARTEVALRAKIIIKHPTIKIDEKCHWVRLGILSTSETHSKA